MQGFVTISCVLCTTHWPGLDTGAIQALVRPGKRGRGEYPAPAIIGPHESDPAISVTEAPAAAVAAFLRGVERRGAVFAELQCGDSEAGDAALAGALRAFRNLAAGLPMADWPKQFWSLLAATPALRQDTPLARWPAPLQALAGMAPRPRAALLLRLSASLGEAEAGAVLGLDEAGYRQLLTDACPRDDAGQPDAAAWRTLAENIQRQLRELPPIRLVRLARMREEALADPRPERRATAAPVPPEFVRTRAHGRQRRWWWLPVVAACAVAGFATWHWWPQIHTLSVPAPAQAPPPVAESAPDGVFALPDAAAVAVEELPPAVEPAARFDSVAETLASGETGVSDEIELAIVRQADFLAWFVAVAETAAAPATGAATPLPDSPEESQTPIPDGGYGIAEELPILAGPQELRAQLGAWEALDETERVRLRDAALRFATLPAPRRQELHAQFDALDALEKRGWRLGPALGAQYPRLHALLAYVPAEEAAAWPIALRSLDASQRDDLALLVRRTSSQDVAALRRELLATAPAQRAAWLQRRLQQ